MKTIDRLLLKAIGIKGSWQVWPCVVSYSASTGKWCACLAAGNKTTREKITNDEYFDDMDSAVQCCKDFIEKYGSESDEATIIINDLVPGGDTHGKSTSETVNPNGS